MRRHRIDLSGYLLTLLFFVVLIAGFLRPIDDPDTFWHLATGKWIVEHRALPDRDPFAFTTSQYGGDSNIRTGFLLHQYWVGELLLYGGYLLANFWGIICIRLLMFVAVFGFLIFWLRRQEVSLLDILLFLVPSAVVLVLFYLGDRPNQMSYLFSLLCLYLVCMAREGRIHTIPILVLMLVWSNIHAGYVLGDIIMMIGLLESIFIQRETSLRKHLVFYAGGLVASLFNPNHLKIIPVLLEMAAEKKYLSFISENISPIQYAQKGHYTMIVIVAVMAGLLVLAHAISLRREGRRGFFHLFTNLVLLFLSLTATRYIPFFILMPLPFMIRQYRDTLGRIPRNTRGGLVAVSIVLFSVVVYYIYTQTPDRFHALTARIYPVETVRFMKDNALKGDIFNSHNIGGYLIWNLYPQNRVFIDSRSLVIRVFYIARDVETGKQDLVEGKPYWRHILDKHRIRYAVISPLDPAGQMKNLIIRLVDAPDWHLNHIDPLSGVMLFSRDPDLPGLPESYAYLKILEMAKSFRLNNPDNPRIYVTLVKLYTLLGRRDMAIGVLEGAIRTHPDWGRGYLGQLLQFIRRNEVVRW